MSFMQRFLTRVFPTAWAEEMRAESLSWMVQCTCGFERSVWELGGIRWKAAGNPRWQRQCPHCGQRTWHTVYRKSDPSSDDFSI
jgi:hypothetical protein